MLYIHDRSSEFKPADVFRFYSDPQGVTGESDLMDPLTEESIKTGKAGSYTFRLKDLTLLVGFQSENLSDFVVDQLLVAFGFRDHTQLSEWSTNVLNVVDADEVIGVAKMDQGGKIAGIFSRFPFFLLGVKPTVVVGPADSQYVWTRDILPRLFGQDSWTEAANGITFVISDSSCATHVDEIRKVLTALG